MRSNESSEDYLETILILGNRSSLVRAVDIAAEMGFKKPSVSVAMKNLRQKNLITVADNGDIRLTEDGHKIADKVYERHQLISSWLMILGVQEKTAIHGFHEDTSKPLWNYGELWGALHGRRLRRLV